MKFPFFKRLSPEKKFQDILGKYKEVAIQKPDDIRIHIKIAELYIEHKKKDKAIEEYLFAAKAYQEKRLFQIAVAIYKHLISIAPEKVDIYTELADLHLRNGFIGDCVAVLEKLANYYYANDMRYEATNVLASISKIDPENKFFKIKVEKFYKTRDLSEKETLKEGPKDKWELQREKVNKEVFDPTHTKSFFDLEAALQDDVSINITTISSAENAETSEISAGIMAPDSVFSELKSLMESGHDKDNPEYHFNLGIALQRCNKSEEAIDEFQKAFDTLEKKVECCIRIAECNTLLNRFDEAQDFIRRGLKLASLTDKEKLELNYQSGLIYKAKGDEKKAMKVFMKIHEAEKDFKSVSREIKQLSQQQKEVL